MFKYFLFLIFFTVSCSKEATPESALKDFVLHRMSSSQSKESILEMTTGKFQKSLQQMNDEQLKAFFKVGNIRRRSFKVLAKKCEAQTCELTYVLKYDQLDGGAQQYMLEVKKIAELININGDWKLSDIVDLKTYIEANSPLNP
jgi:ABC-type Zn uptake system ZnuABC Zn-binding protein ZnuA